MPFDITSKEKEEPNPLTDGAPQQTRRQGQKAPCPQPQEKPAKQAKLWRAVKEERLERDRPHGSEQSTREARRGTSQPPKRKAVRNAGPCTGRR